MPDDLHNVLRATRLARVIDLRGINDNRWLFNRVASLTWICVSIERLGRPVFVTGLSVRSVSV
ncbi:MAG: hypothetical protein FWF25_03470 [Propionibacteriaceae bacterium]|nr:hypothetical protein [Propionibacteriaceae bacterium]